MHSQQTQSDKKIVININTQTLSLFTNSLDIREDTLLKTYTVSTGKNGIGCMEGTGQTPTGSHHISEKIGHNMPINTVFVGRVPTGEIYDTCLATSAPERDWILSRIVWLSGNEEGINKGLNATGCCDTYQRYIYIHGTPDTEAMGVPLSHGCVRMRNHDIIELFDLVDEGIEVMIKLS